MDCKWHLDRLLSIAPTLKGMTVVDYFIEIFVDLILMKIKKKLVVN